MNTTSKKINIWLWVSVAVTIFLLAVSNVYAYFTASASVEGEMQFSNFNITFAYKISGASTYVNTEGVELSVEPSTTGLHRGDSFEITHNESVISNLYFYSASSNCDAFVRFRVNAYKVIDDEPDVSVNYGQYFQLNTNSSVSKSTQTYNSQTNVIYYYKDVVEAGSAWSFADGSGSNGVTMTILDSLPADLTGEDLQITITFDAVQATNSAYITEFADWGYLSSWSTL